MGKDQKDGNFITRFFKHIAKLKSVKKARAYPMRVHQKYHRLKSKVHELKKQK